MFYKNFYIKLRLDKELFYVTSNSGESRRYHIFHLGFDNYQRENPNGTAWTFNIVIPFASFGVGWVFRKRS